jgi:plastocyanin
MARPPDSRGRGATTRLLVAAPVLALTLAGLLAGCGGDDGSADGKAASTDVDVTVDGDTISPTNEQLEIAVGDTVTLHVTADRSGELHVHSSPEQELEFEKGETDLPITLDKPGAVDVEEHASETLVLRILVS